MAVNGFDRSVLSSLWESQLKVTRKITQNQNGLHRDDSVVIFVADVSFPPCFFSFSFDIFSRIYLFVVSGANQGRSCFGKRHARVGMNETGWRTSECPKKHSIVCACGTFPIHFEKGHKLRKAITVHHGVAITFYIITKSMRAL